MHKLGIIAAAAVIAGVAAPATAQDNRGYSSYDYPLGTVHGDGESYAERMTVLQRVAARQRIGDGGTLSARHQQRLDARLRQIVAEENVRNHPVWPGITG